MVCNKQSPHVKWNLNLNMWYRDWNDYIFIMMATKTLGLSMTRKTTPLSSNLWRVQLRKNKKMNGHKVRSMDSNLRKG